MTAVFYGPKLMVDVCMPWRLREDDGYAYRPWQCLYFLPELHGQSSLRPILPQLAGLFGSRSAAAACGTSEAFANAISSSPVSGWSLWASIAGTTVCGSSGGAIATRINFP